MDPQKVTLSEVEFGDLVLKVSNITFKMLPVRNKILLPFTNLLRRIKSEKHPKEHYSKELASLEELFEELSELEHQFDELKTEYSDKQYNETGYLESWFISENPASNCGVSYFRNALQECFEENNCEAENL